MASIASIKNWRDLWLFTSALFIVLIILPLLRHGMFLDGVTYAAIAKNLSLNHGTIWHPFYSATLFPVFYEHPPLALYLESLFFRLFGNHLYVENLYCFCIILGQISLTACYWFKKERIPFPHLALLFLIWVSVPLNTRIFTSNLLECTLTLFTTASTLILLRASKSQKTELFYLFCAALTILLGFLSNGPTAFFPLAVPILQAQIFPHRYSWHNRIQRTFKLLGILIILFISFYSLCPDAWENTKQYMLTQVWPSITGKRMTVGTETQHTHIFYLYFRAVGMVSALSTACIMIAAKIQNIQMGAALKTAFSQPQFLLFFALSLVSAFPVGLSSRQAFNYITQASPFITLAAVYLCYQPVLIILEHVERTAWLKRIGSIAAIGCMVCAIGWVIISGHQFNRDELLLKDLRALLPILPPQTTISVSKEVYEHWISAAYFARFSMISLEESQQRPYYLALKDHAIPPGYHAMALQLHYYTLARANFN